MRPRVRRDLARLAAPVAFLAAVTAAVLLVRSGLNGGSTTEAAAVTAITTGPVGVPATTGASRKTTTKAKSKSKSKTTTGTKTAAAARRYYTIQSGDTLGSIASRFGTTVHALELLNPGVDSRSLTVGQKIRIA